MSLTRKYLKSKPICKVSFSLDKNEAKHVSSAYLVGDFNEWNQSATPMKKLKDGSFKVSLDLDTGRAYQFRYFLNGTEWKNELDADGFITSPYGDSENSIIQL